LEVGATKPNLNERHSYSDAIIVVKCLWDFLWIPSYPLSRGVPTWRL